MESDVDSSFGRRLSTVDSIETAYLRQNGAPVIDAIEMTPPNYRFPDPVAPLTSNPATLSLPVLGSRPSPVTYPLTGGPTVTPAMTWAKGLQGVRWSASDENGDTLSYKVDIR